MVLTSAREQAVRRWLPPTRLRAMTVTPAYC